MTDKKIRIIETAIKLFAQKGFHLTSIQEIADAAGIAKGSMYLYFKSKDDLLFSIYKYYFGLMHHALVVAGQQDDLSPRKRLIAHLQTHFEKTTEFRDFITMQLKEQFFENNDEIKKYALHGQARLFLLLHKQLLEVYGQPFEPWALDCTNMFKSMVTSYIGLIIFYKKSFDTRELAVYLVDRLDDIVSGLLSKQPKPFLTANEMQHFLDTENIVDFDNTEYLLDEIVALKERVEQLRISGRTAKDIVSSLQVIEEELLKTEPKTIIVQGMVSHLRQIHAPELNKKLKRLYALLHAHFDENRGL